MGARGHDQHVIGDLRPVGPHHAGGGVYGLRGLVQAQCDALVHPPFWDPDATELAFAAAQRQPSRFGVMATITLDDPGA